MIRHRLSRVAIAGCAAFALWIPAATVFANFTNGSPPLVNGGGRTQNPSTVYVTYWGEQWNVGWADVGAPVCAGEYYGPCIVGTPPTAYTNAAQTVMTYVNTFLSSAVPGSAWIGSQAQYGASAAWGSSWVDTTSLPALPGVVTDNCVVVCLVDQPPSSLAYLPETTVNEMGSEALSAERHFGYSPNADYMIFLPKGSYPAGFAASYCAYHDEIYDSAGNRISYTVMPYIPDANLGCGENYLNKTDNAFGNGFLDGYSIVAGHELAEVATDALPFTDAAWKDSSGNETGDICAWGTSTDGVPMYSISGGGHAFAVQSLWSNSANTCV